MISAPGPIELLFILGLALLVLGPSRLPDAARSVGRGIRELREALQGNDEDEDEEYYEPEELEDDPGDEDDPADEDEDEDEEEDEDEAEEPEAEASEEELPERS